jgi:hypothetical protein
MTNDKIMNTQKGEENNPATETPPKPKPQETPKPKPVTPLQTYRAVLQKISNNDWGEATTLAGIALSIGGIDDDVLTKIYRDTLTKIQNNSTGKPKEWAGAGLSEG